MSHYWNMILYTSILYLDLSNKRYPDLGLGQVPSTSIRGEARLSLPAEGSSRSLRYFICPVLSAKHINLINTLHIMLFSRFSAKSYRFKTKFLELGN